MIASTTPLSLKIWWLGVPINCVMLLASYLCQLQQCSKQCDQMLEYTKP